jgi:2-amino-4-hydroxy-6-hydroxymethyldihydropteridine diphosphokinase
VPQEENPSLDLANPRTVNNSIIALGSNQPSVNNDPANSLIAALEALPQRGIKVRTVSRFFQSKAFPAGSGPDFVNAVACLSCELEAREVLEVLHEIEDDLGRVRRKRWGPRVVDLDLLAMDQMVTPDLRTVHHWMDLPLADQIIDTPTEMILPHPRLHERGFVLVPLCDVAPDWHHPVLRKTAQTLLDELPAQALAGLRPIDVNHSFVSLANSEKDP